MSNSKPSKAGKAVSGFFSSLGEDIKNSFKKHAVGLIGKAIMFIVPLVYIISMYIARTPSRWALPAFAWIPLVVFIIVYWGKLRNYLAIKVSAMQVENNIEKGKHAGAIILIKTIQVIFTVLPFLLCYFVFNELEAQSVSVKSVFLFITVCETLGGLMLIFDAIANCIDYGEDKEDEDD